MAVTVLLGKAGSGKSTQCYREIQACAAAGGKLCSLSLTRRHRRRTASG